MHIANTLIKLSHAIFLDKLFSEMPTSEPDFTDPFVSEQKQMSKDMFQHLAESLLIRIKAVIAAKVWLH